MPDKRFFLERWNRWTVADFRVVNCGTAIPGQRANKRSVSIRTGAQLTVAVDSENRKIRQRRPKSFREFQQQIADCSALLDSAGHSSRGSAEILELARTKTKTEPEVVEILNLAQKLLLTLGFGWASVLAPQISLKHRRTR